jgi:predicted nucleotidyltransferase
VAALHLILVHNEVRIVAGESGNVEPGGWMNEIGTGSSVTPAISSDILSRLVSLLVDAAQPQKIILFGSHARGEQTEDSNLDVIVILDKVSNRFDEMVRLRRALSPVKMPVDVLVYSEEDRGQWLGTILHEALQEGHVLYGEG